MKSIILAVAFVLVLSTTSFAYWDEPDVDPCDNFFANILNECQEDKDTHVTDKTAEDLKLGVMADLPYLIRLTKNGSLGVQASKDLLNTDAGAGWAVFLKYTWEGTLLNFTK